MEFLNILLVVLSVYGVLLAIWWLICCSASKKAISSKNRAHFDFIEMLDLLVLNFWRFVSYCALGALILWLFLIGRWYLSIFPLLWFVKVWWFGSLFYLPFNIIESHFGGKVEVFYGAIHRRELANDPKNLLNKKK